MKKIGVDYSEYPEEKQCREFMKKFEIDDMLNQILATRVMKEHAQSMVDKEVTKIRKRNLKTRMRRQFLEHVAEWGAMNDVAVVYKKSEVDQKLGKVLKEMRNIKGLKMRQTQRQLDTIDEEERLESDQSDRILK